MVPWPQQMLVQCLGGGGGGGRGEVLQLQGAGLKRLAGAQHITLGGCSLGQQTLGGHPATLS